MAKILTLGDSEIERSERVVLAELVKLPNDWVVAHSVDWQGLRGDRQGDGEADFVIIAPGQGIAVLEVKGGGISVEGKKWYSTNRSGTHPIKDPFLQAKDSKYTLVNMLKKLGTTSSHITVCHGVVFPDVTYDNVLGLHANQELVCDSKSLNDMLGYFESLFKYWNARSDASKSDIQKICSILSPVRSIKRRLSDKINKVEGEIINFTKDQIHAMSAIRYLPKALVQGPAGTGKTVLAEALIQWRVGQYSNSSNLYICYNELLGIKMRDAYADLHQVNCYTFFGLAKLLLSRLPVKIPEGGPGWGERVASLLLDNIDKVESNYSCIIVDEAQDFDSDWMLAIWLLAERSRAQLIIFGDSNQELYQRDWTLPDELPPIPLSVNCRNTKNIAYRSWRALGSKFGEILGPDGPKPVFMPVSDEEDWLVSLDIHLTNLIEDEAVKPNQITVLVDPAALIDRVRELCPAGVPISTVGKHGISSETIRRFKGLDSEVVVFCMLDPKQHSDESFRRLCYVGMSRAKAMLFVMGPRSLRKALGWST